MFWKTLYFQKNFCTKTNFSFNSIFHAFSEIPGHFCAGTPGRQSAEPESTCIFFSAAVKFSSGKVVRLLMPSAQEGLVYFSSSADSRSVAGNGCALGTTTGIHAFPSQFEPFPPPRDGLGTLLAMSSSRGGRAAV